MTLRALQSLEGRDSSSRKCQALASGDTAPRRKAAPEKTASRLGDESWCCSPLPVTGGTPDHHCAPRPGLAPHAAHVRNTPTFWLPAPSLNSGWRKAAVNPGLPSQEGRRGSRPGTRPPGPSEGRASPPSPGGRCRPGWLCSVSSAPAACSGFLQRHRRSGYGTLPALGTPAPSCLVASPSAWHGTHARSSPRRVGASSHRALRGRTNGQEGGGHWDPGTRSQHGALCAIIQPTTPGTTDARWSDAGLAEEQGGSGPLG